MHIQATPLRCRACGHNWTGELVVDAPVRVFIASVKVLHCPSCGAGARSISLVYSPSEAAP